MTDTRTTPSRRRVLTGLATGIGGVAAVGASALTLDFSGDGSGTTGSLWDRVFFSLKNGGFDEWSGLVGSSFRFRAERGPADLTLVAVKPLDAAGRRPTDLGRARAFVAVFEASDSAPAGDRTYSAHHPTYGLLDIFTSAAHRGGRGATRLEAVFN